MRQALAAAALVLLLTVPAAADGATASVEGNGLRISAASGEVNHISVAIATAPPAPSTFSVTDAGAPLVPGPGCTPSDAGVTCVTPGDATLDISAGDLDDFVTVLPSLPSFVDAGPGADVVSVRNGGSDSVWCGAGRDAVTAEVLDFLDSGCERVDYAPAGSVGRLRWRVGGGRLVRVPGQTWARVDRRILADVLFMVRRYNVRIPEGFGTVGHTHFGEHPLGLAVDIEPGPGGSWAGVSRLAAWAEPRQNHPRGPFRWVGWNGDFNHGHPSVCKPRRGCAPHLHLSWSHSPTAPRRIARAVRVFEVRPAAP